MCEAKMQTPVGIRNTLINNSFVRAIYLSVKIQLNTSILTIRRIILGLN